jgi:hypothetical protein
MDVLAEVEGARRNRADHRSDGLPRDAFSLNHRTHHGVEQRTGRASRPAPRRE